MVLRIENSGNSMGQVHAHIRLNWAGITLSPDRLQWWMGGIDGLHPCWREMTRLQPARHRVS